MLEVFKTRRVCRLERLEKLFLSKKFTLQGWGLYLLQRKFFPQQATTLRKPENRSWKPEAYFAVSFNTSWHSLPAVNTSLNAVSLRRFFSSGSSSKAEYAQ